MPGLFLIFSGPLCDFTEKKPFSGLQFNGFTDCYGQSPTCKDVHGDGDDGEIHVHMDHGKSFQWDDESYDVSNTYPICQYTTW